MSDRLPNDRPLTAELSANGNVADSENRIDPPKTAAAASQAAILVIDAAPLALIATAGVLDSEGYPCICARTAPAAITAVQQQALDLLVADVGNDAPAMLELLSQIRSQEGYSDMPAVLLADPQWSGLEKKTEALTAVTRCLFKPIDPGALLAVVEQLLWLPQVVAAHRKRGTRPGRPGWVSL